MTTVHREVVGLVGEVMTEIAVLMTGARGLGAEARDEIEDEAEAQGNIEIEARLGKAVLREEQRLSSGIERRNKQTLLTRMITVTMIMTTRAMASHRMESSMMILILILISRTMEVTTTDPSNIIGFDLKLCLIWLKNLAT